MNKCKSRLRRGRKTKALISISQKPRIVVFRSNEHTYAQLVMPQPEGDKVVACSSTLDKELKGNLASKSKIEQAAMVGKQLGERAKKSGVEFVAFDRSGYKYHGRIKALADGAREAGLKF